MVIVRLLGGLGNQMFQYAAGRRLAMKYSVPLKLDTGWFNYMTSGDTVRHYALGVFSLQDNFATEEEIRYITGKSDSKIVDRLRNVFEKYGLLRAKQGVVREKFFHFDQTILNLPENIYLMGYWQSDKYFRDVEEIIRHDFSVSQPLAGRNLDIAKEIQNCCSVSIHIRRGDYASNPDLREFHGLSGLDYYQRCIDEIAKKEAKPHFFVFSDDHAWTRQHLKSSFPLTHVDHNDISKGYEDLRLMSLCRHNIIANSSFSWWGAWLNTNTSKLVYAPRRWFDKTDIETKDLIPLTWMQF